MAEIEKMKIYEAVREVMKRREEPMTSKEAYKDIVNYKLFEFNTPNPVHIVNTQIRRHCKGIPERKSYSRVKYFKIVGHNKYYYLEIPEVIDGNKDREYWLPKINSSKPISLQEIKLSTDEFKKAVLKEWYLLEYKPATQKAKSDKHSLDTIYTSADILSDEFSDFLEISLITEVANSLDADFKIQEWLKRPNDEDIDEYYIDTEYYGNFQESIKDLKVLVRHSGDLKENLHKSLNRMLYANIITAMESYLSDAFINTVISNEKYIRRLVETTPDLRDRRLNLGEIFQRLDALNQEIQEYLTGKFVWHRLEKVTRMYQSTLEIVFPDKLDLLINAVINRHSLIHRNGKTIEGKSLVISNRDIAELLKEVESFVSIIDQQLKSKRKHYLD